MSASQSGVYNTQQFTDMGAPLVGGRLFTYAFGTTTHKTAYTDHAGTIPHTYTADGLGGQYIALNARGELPAPLYLAAGSYDLALKTAAGVTVWTLRADPIYDATASLRADLAASSGASLVGYMPAGVGAAATTIQAELRFLDSLAISVTDPKFGASPALADNAAAFALVSAAVASGATVFFPDGVYTYSGGLSFPLPVTLTGSSGAVLNYTGAGKAVTLGPTSINAIGSADHGAYVVDGLQFTGGASMTHGIYVPSWVLFPKIMNSKFFNFGNATAYAIFAQGMNWQVLVKDNEFLNTQAVARNFLRTDGYASGLGWDSGNSHLTCMGNNISAISGFSVGVGIAHTGAADIIVGNKIEGFSPNIRSGSSANNTTISKNYFEVITGNNIEFGDVAGGYAPAAYVTGLTVEDNYCNMHALDGSANTGSFVAPSTANTVTGLKFSSVRNNKFASLSQVIPLVKLNNVGSQVGNSGYGNNDGVSSTVPYLRTIASNVTAWLGEGLQALGLQAGVSSIATPQVASAGIDAAGVVHLCGQLKATTTSIAANNILAFLPAGYFPSRALLIPIYDVATLTSTYLAVSTGGGLAIGITLASTSQIDLNGVSFQTSGL